MSIKIHKPTSPGRRNSSGDTFSDITKKEPEKSLLLIRKQKAGRNNQGKITVRHRGGGVKRYIRIVDFKQVEFLDQVARVLAIEYDPNRNARIALIQYPNQIKRYIIAPDSLKTGDTVQSSHDKIDIKDGNRVRLEYIPAGMQVHNIELVPGCGGKLARGAGTSCYIMGVDEKYAQIKLPSSEIRLVPKECLATIGIVSNADHRHIRWGKAGRMRMLGFRPSVRGKVMNPVDHPHGGGEGNQSIGLTRPKTPWGKPALGVKTRGRHKTSQKLIIHRRKKKK